MHRLNELAAQLTPEEIREVENLAERMLSRRKRSQPAATAQLIEREGQFYLDVDRIAGMFADLAPDKSDFELADEASDIIAWKYQ